LTRHFLHFAIVLAGFTALTALLFAPELDGLSTSLLGPPEDNLQDFWNSWYAATGAHAGNFFFTHLIRFPEGVSLIYHSFAYPQVAAVWALSAIFGHDIATLTLLQNLTILVSFPLGAVGGYYLCRHLSGSRAGGALGGFVFAFNPWHIEQAMHHAHVASIEFLPFFVLSYLLAQERKSLKWLSLAMLFYALSALCCWYFLFYGLYFLLFDAVVRMWRVRKIRPRGWAWIAGPPFACGLGAALLLSPLLAPMIANGLRNNAYNIGSNIYVADLLGYTAFPPTHLLAPLGADLYRAFTGNPWEVTVYLGFVNLTLLAFALFASRGLARATLFYALGGMLVFMILASGEALHLRGAMLSVHMPDAVLSKLPFFANVRTPARAMVFVYMFLGVGVALAVTALRTRYAGRWLVSGAAVLMLLDFVPVNLQTTPMACAPELAVLRNDPQTGFGVLDLPDGYLQQDFYMAQQACHGRPIVFGVVARQLEPTLGNRLELSDVAAERRQLARAHVKYVLLHRPENAPSSWDRTVALYRSVYEDVLDGSGLTVLKVY
jgi:hypothetical protein